MFRRASPRFTPLRGLKGPRFARYFHLITTNFIDFDSRGNLASRKVSMIVGNPGETYVLIDPEVGTTIRAASPFASHSAAGAERSCKLTFFHDSQHFGFGSSSYPRLYVPSQMPRQTESNSSPATLFLSGKMYEIVLDGTPDAKFAEDASASGRNLESVLRQLEHM
ncbi:uncharacterized protein N7483_006319 [Penicillium malachiteum]|uniref:uncharacterized protein n=1 Tax=Penicillium malachiteum TaxID=1324776 RepID=UPI002548D075|nr:uncharacterized protein N7483_006319 [Penicillium malachiteum]KAJ5731811.1 hypothetical protein N7483_006319 [Penicillium malachiteum]